MRNLSKWGAERRPDWASRAIVGLLGFAVLTPRTYAQSAHTRPPTAAAEAVAPDASTRATEAFDAGVAAYRRGDYAAARQSFALAYELDPSYRTAAVFGQTEEKLGHLPEAASLLNWALRRLDANVEAEAKARIGADLKLLKGRVLTLKLKTPIPFQEVLIDDLLFTTNSVRVLSEGGDTWTVYLEPAKHKVRVLVEGYHPQERQLEGTPGQLLDWELRWQPVVETNAAVSKPHTSTAATGAEPTPPVATPYEWKLPVAIATGGLALVAAGFGVYSLHQYGDARERFDAARQTLQSAERPAPCGATGSATSQAACDAIAVAGQDETTHGNRAVVSLSAAGALALTSAGFWVWWSQDGKQETLSGSWSLVPRVGLSEWGGALSGTF